MVFIRICLQNSYEGVIILTGTLSGFKNNLRRKLSGLRDKQLWLPACRGFRHERELQLSAGQPRGMSNLGNLLVLVEPIKELVSPYLSADKTESSCMKRFSKNLQ